MYVQQVSLYLCVCVCATKQKTFVQKTQTAKNNENFQCTYNTKKHTHKKYDKYFKRAKEVGGGGYSDGEEGEVGWIEVGPERGRS